MPVSLSLKALGALAAAGILAPALLYGPTVPSGDAYSATVKVAAGVSMVAGSLFLSHAIGDTFLRNGGRGAFKALYSASLAAAGAGVSEAVSGFIPANVLLALSMGALPYSGAGLMLLLHRREVG